MIRASAPYTSGWGSFVLLKMDRIRVAWGGSLSMLHRGGPCLGWPLSRRVGPQSRGVSVQGASVQQVICPGALCSRKSLTRWSLSMRVICPRGVSVQGLSVQESLCPGGLCPCGLYVQAGSLSRGVYVQGVSVQGALCPGVPVQGGFCPGMSLSRGLCPGGLCPGASRLGEPPCMVMWRVVRILLECILIKDPLTLRENE